MKPSNLALWFATILASGCGGPSTPLDGDAMDGFTDATPDIPFETAPPCTATFQLDRGSPTGHAQPLGASATEARAGRIHAADLPIDRTGLATWHDGDFVLANDRVALIIEDAGPSDLYDPWGGKPVGIARVSGGRLVDAGDFNEIILGVGRFVVEATSVGVLHDGSDGGRAVVRTIGTLRALPLINDLARALAPIDYGGMRVALDWELAPGADHAEVFLTFDVTRANPLPVNLSLHAFFQDSRMPRFFPDVGFATTTNTVPNASFIDDEGASYAWIPAGGPLTPFASISGLDLFSAPRYSLPACAQTRRDVARMVIAGPGLDPLQVAVAHLQGTALREVRGTVTTSTGEPAAGVRVHATSADGTRYLTRASTDATGAYVLHVPQNDPVRLTAWRTGDSVPAPQDVPATGTMANFQLAPAGVIDVAVTESRGHTSIPARVQVIALDGPAPSVPDEFGEPQPGSERLHVDYAYHGTATLPVPAGHYRIVVSRGFEYELYTTDVTVADGSTVHVAASLDHVVQTPNIMCGDFHIHTHRSPDAPDSARIKLAAAAADGLEVPVRSDHEFVAAFEPTIADLGLQPWLYGVTSLELTTFAWGHFGVVPLEVDPLHINGGAPDWVGRLPSAVFDEVRSRATAPTVIINHPRSGGSLGGYFDAAQYDPATGLPGQPDHWDTRFTAVEVFNNTDFEANRTTTVRDWFSLLSHGRRVFAVGSSDNHQMRLNGTIGYPRTCLYLGVDDATSLRAMGVAAPPLIRDAVSQGHSFVTGGIFISAVGPGGIGPGQQATVTGASATVHVTVQAASWIQANRLEVILDGASREMIPLDASTANPTNPVIRYERDLNIPVAATGSYVIFAVHGDGDLAPVIQGRHPFGVTNPMFFAR